MENTETTCQACFRPPLPAGADLKSETNQWVSYCRCQYTYKPNVQFTIAVCAKCRRRIPYQAGLNYRVPSDRFELCSCETPDAQKIPVQLKPGEKDPVSLDPASLLKNLAFPKEKYSPIALLGDTARATTFLCRDKERNTRVAVKIFKNIPANLHQTFESEMRKIKQLTHTNIAKVADFGIENNCPYVVSEYKDGFSLEQCMAMYDIPSHDVAVKILISLCEVLVYAQSQSVLHRDIRPGNIIFIDDTNSEPTIAVTDFAMPKIKKSEELNHSWLTLYYSGDEARNLEYNEKAELYTIGGLGYFLLTGQPPFKDGTALDIKNSHALKLPPRISSLKFAADRPRDLEEVIERCLEKDPKERLETIAKLKERLEVFPRRIQMQIEAVKRAKQKAKMLRVGSIALGAVIALAVAIMALGHK